MAFDVLKKRIGNFPFGWALNRSQKTLLDSAFQRLRFPSLLPLPAVSTPLFFRALAPLYPTTNIEQILSGDQKIWSNKLAAQKLTRDNDLRVYYGIKLHKHITTKMLKTESFIKIVYFITNRLVPRSPQQKRYYPITISCAILRAITSRNPWPSYGFPFFRFLDKR